MVSSLKLLKLLFTFRSTFYVINDTAAAAAAAADDDDIGDDDNTYTANNKMIT